MLFSNNGKFFRCSFVNFIYFLDAIPPEITCPDSIDKEAEPGLSSAEVTWKMPVYSDNLDGTDALTVTVHPAGLKPSHRFEIGSVRVRYTVTDTAGLSAECYFKVVILGKFEIRT